MSKTLVVNRLQRSIVAAYMELGYKLVASKLPAAVCMYHRHTNEVPVVYINNEGIAFLPKPLMKRAMECAA